MRFGQVILMMVSVIGLVSCATPLPKPVSTEHIVTEAAGFVLGGEPRAVRYQTGYTFRGLESGKYVAVVSYENPVAGGERLRVVKHFRYPVERLIVESPALESIRSGENYGIELVLHRGSVSGPVVDRHMQKVNFGISPEVAQRFGLETRVE